MSNKEVTNGPIARVVRTIGYALVLLGAVVIVLDVLRIAGYAFLEEFIRNIESFLLTGFGVEVLSLRYRLLIFGTILLIGTLSKNIALIVITILLVLLVGLNIDLTGALYFDGLIGVLGFSGSWTGSLATFFNNTINANTNVALAFNVLAPFMVYIVIASKKPSRIATKGVSSGFLIVSLVAAFLVFPYMTDMPFLHTNTYLTIVYSVLLSGIISLVSGSIFGVLGFFRK